MGRCYSSPSSVSLNVWCAGLVHTIPSIYFTAAIQVLLHLLNWCIQFIRSYFECVIIKEMLFIQVTQVCPWATVELILFIQFILCYSVVLQMIRCYSNTAAAAAVFNSSIHLILTYLPFNPPAFFAYKVIISVWKSSFLFSLSSAKPTGFCKRYQKIRLLR